MNLAHRARGWLNPLLHSQLREAMLQVGSRHGLIWPVYCLMPDHAHFLTMGIRTGSDQRLAIPMFRRLWNERLENGFRLDRQAHDHVLREEERREEAFQTLASYILNNPVRGGLVEERSAWAYCGSIVPGYPSLNPKAANFWTSFWMAYDAVVQE